MFVTWSGRERPGDKQGPRTDLCMCEHLVHGGQDSGAGSLASLFCKEREDNLYGNQYVNIGLHTIRKDDSVSHGQDEPDELVEVTTGQLHHSGLEKIS